ncbi:PAS-domain containing protein [Ferrimonas balearica]|uniref:hybrid sensor histidine kinase/response regulator n=1 Tax=Ferrimonas balearica TaxID=44012 RepID=UPI001C9914FD|nr:PAS-domain containing protein [Ferrimonas balearica]MBY5921716.1 hybrid sensor histidine kinase/response regulator [Ferrimonas balearica]MBY5994944.1 hybrid sensor histidine kinase/response regulator [Ferrimonas balearica]
MFANWLLVAVSLGYIGLLFLIAFLGDRFRHRLAEHTQRLIYALSLGVYCTSWGFLGTAGQAAVGDFSYLPVYLAPILLFLLAWPFIQRIIRVSLRLNITSIADLLAARFGKSQRLALLVTLVALIGTLPYIALQLKAIVNSYLILRQDPMLTPWQLGLVVALVLAGFTIVFGVRTIDVTERHPGVMVAIAFESLLKLVAYLVVGLFVCFVAFDSPAEILAQTRAADPALLSPTPNALISMAGLTVVVVCAFLCLPRQFQVTMVELKSPQQARLSRWLFPAYVAVFALFAAPLGLAGKLLYGDSVATDAYVLFLPAAHGHDWLSLFSFLGAISAASAMVIISTMALSIMLSNEVIFPTLFRHSDLENTHFQRFRTQLLGVRKALVVAVIALAYGMFLVAPPHTLASLGEVAFGAIAQIGPPLFAAFLWRRVTLAGVLSGISAGFSLWLVLNLLPQLGLYGHPFANSGFTPTTVSTLLGLAVNATLMWGISVARRPSVREQIQMAHFFERPERGPGGTPLPRRVDAKELELLAARFVGEEKAQRAFATTTADSDAESLLLHTEKLLATVMGSASARLVISCALQGHNIALEEVAQLVEDASSQRTALSREVLQSAIENASEGISVTDHNLRLVAWNDRYLKLFQYPTSLLYPGCPVADLIAYNLAQTLDDEAEIEHQVARRLAFLRQGSRHSSERQMPDGTVIRIEGNPMPGGGFVMLFTDITVYREAEALLTEKNLDLEQLVSERSDKLAKANAQLARSNAKLAAAHEQAEAAHRQKSQYLKACSHDLLQPLSAARLFSSTLMEDKELKPQQRAQIERVDRSLQVANELLLDLNAIARLESGAITPKPEPFPLQALLDDLAQEFAALAPASQVHFRCVRSRVWVHSDRALLRRILQNLMANALRHAPGSTLLLGCRRGDPLSIEVIDNGPGIPEEKQTMVFEQFTRLDESASTGLGLGLNIARGLADLLGHGLRLQSAAGQGCRFTLTLQEVAPVPKAAPVKADPITLQGVKVLCVDNDPEVLAGMTELLNSWQCEVMSAPDRAVAEQWCRNREVDIMLVDYQLDRGDDGLSLMASLQAQVGHPMPGILISATTDEQVVSQARSQGYGFLRKLIKPAALRATMSALLVREWKQNYVAEPSNRSG